MKKQKVSVIITSYNNGHNITECLKSLTSQDYHKDLINLEIIIIDSGSTDNSIGVLNKNKNKIKIILNPPGSPRLSPATARNIAVRSSQGEILIFSDSDCSFPPNWIKDMILSFKNPETDCIIGNREPDVGKGMGAFYRRYNFLLYSRKSIIPRMLFINEKTIQKGTPLILIAANNFAIKREIWDKIGGMKECFTQPACEDIMMELELFKKGYNILFNPTIKITHHHSLSLRKLVRKAFYQGEGISLVNKYFKGYIEWEYFLQLEDFFKDLIFLALFFLIINVINIFPLYKVIVWVSILLMLIQSKMVEVKTRLKIILNSKNEIFKKRYRLSLLEIFYFVVIDFFVKITRLLGFIYSGSRLKILKYNKR